MLFFNMGWHAIRAHCALCAVRCALCAVRWRPLCLRLNNGLIDQSPLGQQIFLFLLRPSMNHLHRLVSLWSNRNMYTQWEWHQWHVVVYVVVLFVGGGCMNIQKCAVCWVNLWPSFFKRQLWNDKRICSTCIYVYQSAMVEHRWPI